MTKDVSKVLLDCQGCGLALITIWDRSAEKTQKVKAICPQCGDSSLVKEVNGGFSITMGDSGVTDFTDYSFFVDGNNVTIFSLEK